MNKIDISNMNTLDLIQLKNLIELIINKKLPKNFNYDKMMIKCDLNKHFIIYNENNQYCIYDYGSNLISLIEG